MAEKYIPKIPSEYSESQIVLNSDRLVFNARKDSVFLFADKSIGFGSNGTVNIDTEKYFIVNSPKNYLGLNSVNEDEPAILGGKFDYFMNQLFDLLHDLGENIEDCEVSTEGGNLISLNMAGTNIKFRLQELKRLLPEIYSKITYLE